MTDSTQTPQTQTKPALTLAEKLPIQWPLRFKSHGFDVSAFDILAGDVIYNNRSWLRDPRDSFDKPRPSIESFGRPLDQLLGGSGIATRNFPPPAQVTWKSKDGTLLSAQIDIAKIFADELIRHNLTKEEISVNTLKSDNTPVIFLVINNRTISVYTRTFLSTKVEQRPGNKHSNYRDDLIQVFSQTY